MANLARSSLSKLFNNFCAVSRPPSLQLHVANGPRAAEAKEKERLPAGFRPPRVFSLVLKDVYQPHMKISEVGKLASQRLKSLSSQDIKVSVLLLKRAPIPRATRRRRTRSARSDGSSSNSSRRPRRTSC